MAPAGPAGAVVWYHLKEPGQTVTLTFRDESGTEIAKADTFWRAEDYHQNFYQDNPSQPYCMMVISPKMQKFRKEFADKLT